MAEAAFAIGGATNLVTELIKALITITGTAVRCQEECRELEEELKVIQPAVEHIELQLQELKSYNLRLKLVEDWLERLKAKLHLASIKVHKCNTASRIVRTIGCFGSYTLSKKITALNIKITALASERVTLTVQLESMLEAERSKHPPREWQKRIQEINEIKRREETTRLSERRDGSVHNGNGSPFYAADSSQHSSHRMNYHPDPHQFHRTYTTPSTTPY